MDKENAYAYSHIYLQFLITWMNLKYIILSETQIYLPQLIFATTYICIHTHIYVYNNNDRFLDAVFSLRFI